MTPPTVAEIPVLLIKPEEAATALRIGRTKVYELMRSGELPSVRIGGLRRIRTSVLADYVAQLEEQERAA